MIRKSNKQQLKEYFLLNPTKKLRVRQIERETKTPLPSVTKYVKELAQEGILKQQHIAGMTIYTSNRNNHNYKLSKKLFNIKQLYKSKLIEQLINKYDNPTIILFGSYNKGEDTEDSDIDLYIETPTKKEINLQEYGKKLKRNIQLLTYKNLKEIKSKELKNNIINGTIINGYIEVFT